MTSTATLIKKLWAGAATAEELDLLHELLADENCSLKEELLRAYEHSLLTGVADPLLDPKREREILTALNNEIESEKRNNGRLAFLRRNITWAAACLILFFAGTIFWSKLTTQSNKQANEHLAGNLAIGKGPSIISNHSDTSLAIVLKDSSYITLMPGSDLLISHDFDVQKRDIELIGSATFKVAKDPQRPFTVLAKGFKTTALGTQFTINTLTRDTLDIKLIEGKVVVRQCDWKTGDDEVFLMPDQEFIRNVALGSSTVTRFVNDQLAGHKNKTASTFANVDFVFDNEPLNNVFAKLQTAFNTPIQFDSQELAEMTLTGTFRKKEGLQKVLAVICNMNDLESEERQGAIIISKKK